VAEPCQCIAGPHSVKYSTLQAYNRGKIKSKVPVCVIQSHIRRVLFQDSSFIGCHTVPLVWSIMTLWRISVWNDWFWRWRQ